MRRRIVRMNLSENFFNKFEFERRKLQTKLGIKNLSQMKFSELIAKNIQLNKSRPLISNVKKKRRTI
jgi:hypothetical protein